MTISENRVNEICKAFVYGETIEKIAEVEQLPIEQVKQILADNAEVIQQLKTFYKSMEVSEDGN